jgi:hypothetical protein
LQPVLTDPELRISELEPADHVDDDDLFEISQGKRSRSVTARMLRGATSNDGPSRPVDVGNPVNMTLEDGEVVILMSSPTDVYLPPKAPFGHRARVSDGSGVNRLIQVGPSPDDPAGVGTINGAVTMRQMAYAFQTTLFRSLGNNNWSIL